jgi:hypothetical protein
MRVEARRRETTARFLFVSSPARIVTPPMRVRVCMSIGDDATSVLPALSSMADAASPPAIPRPRAPTHRRADRAKSAPLSLLRSTKPERTTEIKFVDIASQAYSRRFPDDSIWHSISLVSCLASVFMQVGKFD